MLGGYQKWHKGFAGYHQGRVLFYVLGRHVVSLGKMLNCVKFLGLVFKFFNCEELSLELDPRFYQKNLNPGTRTGNSFKFQN